MKTLSIEISGEIIQAFERTAKMRGRPVAEEAREWLAASARVQDRVSESEFRERVRKTREKLAAAGVWITQEDIRQGIEEGRE